MDYYQQGPQSFGERDPYAPQENREQRVPIVAEDVIKLSEKVVFPIEEYPGYNFVGRLLGPKGSTLKALQASTKTKMSILGKGSSKDKKKEEELRKSDDPEHAHFKEPLHVLVQVQAPKIEAHRKISAALKEIYRFMAPDIEESMPEQMNERPFNNNDGGRFSGDEGLRGSSLRGPPGAMPLNNFQPRDGSLPLRGGGAPHQGGSRPPRGGGQGPPPPAIDQYGYNDGYYDGGQQDFFSRSGEKRIATSNGFVLKRFRDAY